MYAERLDYTFRDLRLQYVEEIDPIRIDAYVRERLAAGLSPRTANIQVAVIRRMLDWAVEEGLITRNGLERWKPVRDPGTVRRRAFTPDELQRFLKASPAWQRIIWAVMAGTGIRKGEATHLLTSDFDSTQGVIRIRREITKTNRDRVCPLPKGLAQLLSEYLERERLARPRRQREYLARLRSELKQLKSAGQGQTKKAKSLAQMEKIAISGLGHQRLFANGKGLPLRKNLDREFRAGLERAGIDRDGLCIHSLRYTANSTLLAAGVPETVIRARMGHVTSKMTERYFDPLADNGAGTGAVASLHGVEDGAAETPVDLTRAESNGRLSLDDEKPFRPTAEMLVALTERYSNIAIGKILDVSEAAVRMMLKRAGIKRASRIETRLDDWQAAIIRAELKAELARKENAKRTVTAG
jgi:integrase